jgi:dihydrofolate reductase
MRKLTVLASITLDGVMQGMGSPVEDTSNNFPYGGWSAPYADEVSGQMVRKELDQPVDYLLGRTTFENWEGYWPTHASFWPGINRGTKYVLSATREKSSWQNTEFIKTVADVQRLIQSAGPNLQVWGSSQLVQLLLQHDWVNELRLKVFPLTLGQGKKLFQGGTLPASFKLVECLPTPSGIIIANYQRAGNVVTGTVGA